MRPVIDDGRSRLYLALGLAVALLVATGAWIATQRIAATLQSDLAERVLAMAAHVVSEDPESAGRIASMLTGELNTEAAGLGLEVLQEYGLHADVMTQLNPALQAASRLPVVVVVATLLSGAGATGLAVLALRRTFRAVDQLTNAAARVADGEYRLQPDRETEGSMGRLRSQIRQTAHRLAEQVELAQESRESLRSFLSDVSHQLKTPLASIRMYHELLLQMQPDEEPDRKAEFLNRSLGQIDRMEWLVTNLLLEARMEAGALPLSLEERPLGATVEEAASAFHERAETNGVTLRLELPPKDVPVSHDRRWLAEAVSNLVKNGLDHTPEGGTVTVSVHHSDAFSRIVVADTGPGIALEDLPHVFTRFYRGRQTPSSREPGTGLGLALSRAIVERHGGVISATSSQTGPQTQEGARFTITLPHLTEL